MNETRITVHGNVVTEPVQRTGRTGSVFTTFRIAHTPFRRGTDGKFYDGDTSYYSVITFNALAANAATALRKGQPVVVEGNLAIKQYVGTDGQSHTAPEIDADHLGHDLSWGRSVFERVSRAAALGHDRTADPDVQASTRALAEGAEPPRDRPAHVDEDGVVADDFELDEEQGHDQGLPDGLGDPETDDYEVVSALSA